MASAADVFLTSARGVAAAGAPETAELLRRCAGDGFVLGLLPAEPAWDVPQRLLASVRVLVLAGEVEDFERASDPWPVFRAAVAAHEAHVCRFVREQTVQTNEPQRCWALLPLFLTVARAARRPLDLIELGPAGGLNLLWDRYRYAFAAGGWGAPDAPLLLRGDERSPVPASLLGVRPEVRRRRGIDLHPIDVASEAGLRLLLSFSGRPEYRAQVRAAAVAVAGDPPELLRGDYLDLLPQLLGGREEGVLTVVFQTHSSVYLSDDGRARLREVVDAAAATGPLGWISTPTPEEHGERRGDYPLELALWPGGGRRIVARTNVHGSVLDWLGDD